MGKIYYQGKIVELSKLQNISLSLGDFYHSRISETADKFLKVLDALESDISTKLISELKNSYNHRTIDLSNTIFDNLKGTINAMYMDYYRGQEMDIVYEIVTSKNGDLYGRELHTGLLFPIANLSKIKYRVSKEILSNVVKNEKQIYYISTKDSYYMNKKSYRIQNHVDKKIVKYSWFTEEFYTTDSIRYSLVTPTVFTINPSIDSFENLSLCETIVFNSTIANQNEMDRYLNRFKGLNRLFDSKKKFIRQVTGLYNKNIFNSIVEEIKAVERPKIQKDKMTLRLENIEYLLAILKKRNIEAYEEMLKEYNNIISSEEQGITLSPIVTQNLLFLEGKIEFYLNYAKNDVNHISQLLNNLKNEYLENFSSGVDRTTKLTISDIDKINELFLKTKSRYSVKEQQQVFKDISFLYVMELMENSTIKTSNLENSYFKDNLKYIMVVIMSLIESDIIRSNVFIDYEMELDLYSVFSIIKNLELKKVKVKVKE